jgi:hypothetical protein
MVGLDRLPRLIEPARKRYVLEALAVLIALMMGYIMYMHATELQARTIAMQMYKLYQRKMATVALYVLPQESREIDSQWALIMTGKADLQAVDQRLMAHMRQHGLIADSPPEAKPD